MKLKLFPSFKSKLIQTCLGFSFLLLIITNEGYFLYAQQCRLTVKFDPSKTPLKPDYTNNSSWAALPFIKDAADTFAGEGLKKEATDVDVFFVHPTSYTDQPVSAYPWNADLIDQKINQKTDNGSIRYQASVFNGVGRIFAPRYRQAHYDSYITKDTQSARMAFEIAYRDVETAFNFYLENYNGGRPIIIASHSQGTTHAIRLLQNYFDKKPLSEKLICAYLIGMPVYDTMFSALKPCENESQTGCYCTWRTYATGYFPKDYTEPKVFAVCTNPLSWSIEKTCVSSNCNKGGILRDMNKIIPGLCDAAIADGVLRINRPNFPGSIFLTMKNYHIADYNLFYMNLNENAILRSAFFKKKLHEK